MWSFIATQPWWLKVTFWSLSSKTPTLFKSVPFLYYPKKVAELHGSDDSRSKLEDAKPTLLMPSHLQTNKKLRFACWMLGKSSKDILPNGGFISNLQWHKVNNHQKKQIPRKSHRLFFSLGFVLFPTQTYCSFGKFQFLQRDFRCFAAPPGSSNLPSPNVNSFA